MSFVSVKTIAFRNLEDVTVDTSGKEIFLVGENGQGKTNFLEALYLCSYGSSFRASSDRELIQTGKEVFSVVSQLKNSIYDTVIVKYQNNKKEIYIDSKLVKSRKDLISVIPLIIFSHEDMEFISGTPERRRWFFDQSLSLYDAVYLDELQRYRHVLKTRNKYLKERRIDMLDVVTTQLIDHGKTLVEKRAEAIQLFSKVFNSLYEKITRIHGLTVQYVSSWQNKKEDELMDYIKKQQEKELLLGVTLSGPHRDKYYFFYNEVNNNEDIAVKASTGQRRLMALLLRVVQAVRFFMVTGREPVLLLDDVLLELDPEKRRCFLSVLPDYDQAFFTFLPEEPFERYRKSTTMVYYIKGGRFLHEKSGISSV